MANNDRIVFESNGAKYTLEFDRDTAVKAERAFGISLAELQSGKTYIVHDLFVASFMKHHPHIKGQVVEEFFKNISNKSELYSKLVTMYAAAAGSLLEEPEDEGKAISWKAE